MNEPAGPRRVTGPRPARLVELPLTDRVALDSITRTFAVYLTARRAAALKLVTVADQVAMWIGLGVEPPEVLRHELEDRIKEWEGHRWTPFRPTAP
jgi:hypothetical protein